MSLVKCKETKTAVRLCRENIEEIVALCLEHRVDLLLSFDRYTIDDNIPASEGDWIVVNSWGRIKVVMNDTFLEKYELVEL